MKVIAVNGSPRKQWNTAMLLQHAIEGAASKKAETKLVHLYDLNYKGCISCFACKLKGGPSHGRCAVKDDLKPLLDEIHQADALILGSPIYFGSITGEMRCFLERLAFQYLEYKPDHGSLYKGKIRTGCITTMNVSEGVLEQYGYDVTLKNLEGLMQRLFGHCESLTVTDTLQFDDYTKYDATLFDGNAKKRRREEIFPEDCKKAFDMGARFVTA